MKVLITTGATEVPIDQVRVISNVFTGKTGTGLGFYFAKQGYDVTLVTSNPALAQSYYGFWKNLVMWVVGFFHVLLGGKQARKMNILPYRTFDELSSIMESEIKTGTYDVVIHSAAVSDFTVGRVLVRGDNGELTEVDRSKKISSSGNILLEMVPTYKIVDRIREWGFHGMLVKFKLQVGITDEALLEIAGRSLHASQANLIVANCLEWYEQYAYMLSDDGTLLRTSRKTLAQRIEENVCEYFSVSQAA